MKHPNETAIVYNTIKKDTGFNDEALSAIGISKERISKALDQCISKGLSKKKAMDTVFRMWKKADPDVQSNAPTAKEMELMGLIDKDGTWLHYDTGLTLTADQG